MALNPCKCIRSHGISDFQMLTSMRISLRNMLCNGLPETGTNLAGYRNEGHLSPRMEISPCLSFSRVLVRYILVPGEEIKVDILRGIGPIASGGTKQFGSRIIVPATVRLVSWYHIACVPMVLFV